MCQAVCDIVPDFVNLTTVEKFNLILSLNNGDTELIEPVLKFVSDGFEKRADIII